ncbi:MAG: hypothetical protein GW892_15390, partial [Armatimonadetes bacterium]|nr:hypothetical protein [Armatimonadota bacterium]
MRVPVLLSVVLSLTLAWVGAPGTLRAEEAAAPAAPPTAVTAGGLSFQVLQECEDPEYCFRFSLTPPAGKAEPYVAKLLFGYQDEKNYYSLALGREAALLTCRSQGVSSKLASWSGPTLRAEGATPLILRREAS